MLLAPSQNMPKQFFDYQLNVKFTEGVKAVELDIEIFKKEANKTIKEINKLLKSYGHGIKIVSYEEGKELKYK